MNFLTSLSEGAAAERLGWTLVHFGWQGVAIAAALAVVLRIRSCRRVTSA